MKEIHISIQHILKDLMMIFNLLKGKTTESIFVNIYSKDGITLNAAKEFMTNMFEREANIKAQVVSCQKDMESFLNEQSPLRPVAHEDEPLTQYMIFDKLSMEMLQLKRYPFLLKWYQKIWVLALNPVTLFLTSRWRLVFNLIFLYATIFAYGVLPENSIIQYALGENSPLLMLIWLPYLILLLVDFKYLTKLNLLMSEMTRRQQTDSSKGRTQTILILNPCVSMNENSYRKIRHMARVLNAHLVHFTDQVESKSYSDLSFDVPEQNEAQLLKYMGVLSGHAQDQTIASDSIQASDVIIRPIEAVVLEAFNSSGLMSSFTPSTCYKLVLNYEYLSSRYPLNKTEKTHMATVLLKKYAAQNNSPSIGFNTGDVNPDLEKVKEEIYPYL